MTKVVFVYFYVFPLQSFCVCGGWETQMQVTVLKSGHLNIMYVGRFKGPNDLFILFY